MTLQPTYDIAIIGGGASGTLVALHLLRAATTPRRIALIEPATVAQGVAYSTSCAEHVLNVPAMRMSAFEDAADDFVAFLAIEDSASGDRSTLAASFAPRRRYGAYLRARLAQARAESPATLEVIANRVVGCVDAGEQFALTLDSGDAMHAHAVVLALGNTPRPLPVSGQALLPAGSVIAAWDYPGIKAIPPAADVTVVGAGHSMVDVALSLSAQGHRGAIHVLSRNALLPLPHDAQRASHDFDPHTLDALPLRARVRVLRRQAASMAHDGVAWQALMDRLRPQVRTLWRSLSPADQRRFMRHMVRLWDVHRHRIATDVDALLQAMRARGQMRLHRGRLAAVRRDGDRLRVEAVARDGTLVQWQSDVIVNAVGLEMRVARMGRALLDDLVAHGLARPGPHGIGLDTDEHGALLDTDARAHPHLFAIGSLRIGTVWESIAVPDLRQDAAALAARLLARAQVFDDAQQAWFTPAAVNPPSAHRQEIRGPMAERDEPTTAPCDLGLAAAIGAAPYTRRILEGERRG